jgi:hypothetical protein
MRYTGALMLLLIGVAGVAFAGVHLPAPEIDPSAGVSALALLGGAAIVILARRKR